MSDLPVYYLVISLVVCASLLWIRSRAIEQNFEIRFILDLSLLGMVSGFIGARALHVLYEYPDLYFKEPWRIFDFGRGGYVYYGGLLLGLCSVWLFLHQKKTPGINQYFDLAAPVISFGYAAGRVACLLSGCCYGPISDVFWAVNIQDESGLFHHRHPTPLYASLTELIILYFVLSIEKNREHIFSGFFKTSGQLFFIWLFLHSAARFFLEFWRDDFRGPQYLFSISGWISLALICFSLIFLLDIKSTIRQITGGLP